MTRHLDDARVVALEPRRLRARCRNRTDALQLAGRLRKRVRFLERFMDRRVPSARPHEAEHGQREDTRHGPRAWVAQHARCRIRGFGPVAAIELEPRAARDEEQPPEVEAAIVAVRESLTKVTCGELVFTLAQRPPHEVEQRSSGVLVERRIVRQTRTPLDRRRTIRIAAEEVDDADVRQRVDERLRVTPAFGELTRTRPPFERCRSVVGGDRDVRHVRVRHRELVARPERLENRDRLTSRASGLVRPADEAQEAGLRAQRVALGNGLVDLVRQLARRSARDERLVEAAGDIALVRVANEQIGTLGRGQPCRVPKSSRVMLGRLAMRTGSRGTRPGRRRELEHCLGVTRPLGVMCEASEIRFTRGRLAQRLERPLMQRRARVRAD